MMDYTWLEDVANNTMDENKIAPADAAIAAFGRVVSPRVKVAADPVGPITSPTKRLDAMARFTPEVHEASARSSPAPDSEIGFLSDILNGVSAADNLISAGAGTEPCSIPPLVDAATLASQQQKQQKQPEQTEQQAEQTEQAQPPPPPPPPCAELDIQNFLDPPMPPPSLRQQQQQQQLMMQQQQQQLQQLYPATPPHGGDQEYRGLAHGLTHHVDAFDPEAVLRHVPALEDDAPSPLHAMATAAAAEQQQQQAQQTHQQQQQQPPHVSGGGTEPGCSAETYVDDAYRSLQTHWARSSSMVEAGFESSLSAAGLWHEVQRLQLENQQLREANAQIRRTAAAAAALSCGSGTPTSQSQSTNGMNAAAAAWQGSPIVSASSPLHQSVLSPTPSSPGRFGSVAGTQGSAAGTTGASTAATTAAGASGASAGGGGSGLPHLFPLSPGSADRRNSQELFAEPMSPLTAEKAENQIDKAKLKTKLCKYYMQTNSEQGCPFFGRHGWCAFAHGDKELLTTYVPVPVSPLMLSSPGGMAFDQYGSQPMSPFALSDPSNAAHSPVTFG